MEGSVSDDNDDTRRPALVTSGGLTQIAPGRFVPAAEAEANKDNPFYPSNLTVDPRVYWVPPPKGGDATPASCRLSSQTHRQIQEIVASRAWPFATPSDLVRAAVHWFLIEKVMPLEPRLSDELRAMQEETALAQRAKELVDYERQVALRVDHLLRLWKLGMVDEAVATWDEVERYFTSRGAAGAAMLKRLQERPELTALREEVKRRWASA
jgi:hypothetical protein